MKAKGNKANTETCEWYRVFDGHFNISCPSGERANGQFKGENTTWNFKFCPYCGRVIELVDEE